MIEDRLEKIRLLLLDADGVLTRGEIIYSDRGVESKSFDVKDGFGIRMLREAGIKTGIVSGRNSGAVEQRARELKVDFCHCGVADKKALLDDIVGKAGCSPQETAFVGDDIPDMAIMNSVGIGIAVADADDTVKKCADMVTLHPGGRGAVREVCERILKAKGLWEGILQYWA